jgi:hypothetical protein
MKIHNKKNYELKQVIKEEPTHASTEMLNGSLKNIEILSSKQRRQCCMEWAFLASILDRICLLIFSSIVFIVTIGMIFTGMIVQNFFFNSN